MLGSLAGLALSESFLHWLAPRGGGVLEREQFWLRGAGSEFVVDPEFGFRPRLGDDRTSPYGTHVNAYGPAKRPGVQRLLFIGDSVTARGRIVRAIEHRYGHEEFEYWNAGVGSFNTVQEVNYYKKFNAAIRPDHVILTFHNNDFETTPVAFFQDGELVVYSPDRPLAQVHPWLFRHSHVYRIWRGLGARLRGPSDAIVAETEASLLDLKRTLEREQVPLTVLLLPLLAEESRWRPLHRRSRQQALAILERHGFRYFDLLAPMNDALRDGQDIQERPGDVWHPSDAVAARFGEFLFHNGLFSTAGPIP